MNIIEQLEKEQAAALAKKRKIPEFAPGDTLQSPREGGRGRKRADGAGLRGIVNLHLRQGPSNDL